jgi:hypothetical protein
MGCYGGTITDSSYYKSVLLIVWGKVSNFDAFVARNAFDVTGNSEVTTQPNSMYGTLQGTIYARSTAVLMMRIAERIFWTIGETRNVALYAKVARMESCRTTSISI